LCLSVGAGADRASSAPIDNEQTPNTAIHLHIQPTQLELGCSEHIAIFQSSFHRIATDDQKSLSAKSAPQDCIRTLLFLMTILSTIRQTEIALCPAHHQYRKNECDPA